MIKNLITLIRHGVIGTLILAVVFITIEPAVSLGATATSQFTISQTVTAEIAFATTASNVIMSPTLGGITGGTSNGATSVAVKTNNLTGYNMTIMASTSSGMQGVASSTNFIPAYISTVPGVPDYTFSSETNSAGFGYAVNATTSTDVAQLFRSAGSTPCNTGAVTSSSACWLAATTTAVTIINRSTPTPSTGATTTLSFRVVIGANPSPVIPNDTYVATTTLTATTNP
jgi:hypothetical protein